MLSARDVEHVFEPDSGIPRQPSNPMVMAAEALHGLPGDIVRSIEPYSEADPVALLLNTLAAFGNVIGSSAYATAGHDEHPGRMFVVEVGQTSIGRKGSGWSPIRHMFSRVDPSWAKDRIKSGLSSGEGLVFAVRDPVPKQEPIKDKGKVIGYQEVITDPGEGDKRLMIIEPEFASTLTVMERQGNNLSTVLRQAWDNGDLSPLTKNNPIKATGAHITLITHITSHELLCRLDDTSKANGFANRFLWALVKRSKELPEGDPVPDEVMEKPIERLTRAIDFARKGGMVKRSDTAREQWAKVYGLLSAGKAGLTGAILSRAEAQVLRLSVLYALLDSSSTIFPEHLKAALAVWEYCERSAEAIFGKRLGDPLADRIIEALRGVGEKGLSDNDIYELFGRNRSARERDGALSLLKDFGLVRSETVTTAGRPRTVWVAT